MPSTPSIRCNCCPVTPAHAIIVPRIPLHDHARVIVALTVHLIRPTNSTTRAMERIEFDINESLKLYLSDPTTIPTQEVDGSLLNCENDAESFTPQLINGALNPVVDAVAESPDALLQGANFDTLQFLLKCVPTSSFEVEESFVSTNNDFFARCRSSSLISPQSLSKVLDIVVSGLSAEANCIQNDLDSSEDAETVQHHKQMLEAYGFLLQWCMQAVEAKAAEKSASNSATAIRARGGKGGKAKASKDAWDASGQVQTALDVMSKVQKLKLQRIFLTTSERDTFISLFTRAVYTVMESEARVKNTAIRMHCFKVLCIAVKHHGHATGAQTSIVQNLTYFEHLSEPMAEFLHILTEQYDHPQLAEEVLRELSSKEFNANDLKGPKSVSTFTSKLSELAPRLVIRQMSSLAKFLDSESYTLRCAIIDVCGNLIAMLSKLEAGEQAENHKAQLNAFFDVLEERFLDVNPYCRCRALQVYVKLCDLEQKFPKKRQTAAELTARSLEDKSSNVRRNAVRLLGKLVSTHPFNQLHGGQLSMQEWEQRLDVVSKELNALKPPAGTPGLGEKNGQQIDENLHDEATQLEKSDDEPKEMSEEEKRAALEKAAEEAATSEAVNKLQLTRKYYLEALKFIQVIHDSSPVICQLLMSKNKSEVIEAMDFFMIADAYKVETARQGIRKMLHLIWTKGNSDEGKGVQTHLIECYKTIFFDAPDTFSANDAATYIARNMISLTFGSTLAEMTSLEQLLSTMMKAKLISEHVVAKLWQVYSVQRNISKSQRRGAIIILGMLATANPQIAVSEIEAMLTIGLGGYGRADLVLAKYTCIALARIKPASRKASPEGPKFSRLPNDHAVLTQLAAMAEFPSDSKEWYGVAEQAIGAIYALSKHPDVLCSQIIRRRTKEVFQRRSKPQPRADDDGDVTMGDEGPVQPPEDTVQHEEQRPAAALAQLLFLVGHVAIKQIVHLELCELDFKRRKAEREKEKPAAAAAKKSPATEDNELDLIGGTTEDDFTEAMQHIREREMLYGANALLSNFGPLVTEICSNNKSYRDRNLQAIATICMAKLMCVSSEYCEKNLPLLITIMERSEDATTRSNVVIALGDMAVCFNNLIDENTDFLYRRLNDADESVKRTCLMTLTFLILAGQVKVKGQLGEMAKCLEDADKRIADLSRMFFSELATKDNAVYNQYVDMFSVLSADEQLEEESFRKIIKFISSFIEKVGGGSPARMSSATLTIRRTNMPSSWRRSWPAGSRDATTSGSGTTSPTRCRCCSTRTRRSRRRSRKASRWCRRRRDLGAYVCVWGSVGCVAFAVAADDRVGRRRGMYETNNDDFRKRSSDSGRRSKAAALLPLLLPRQHKLPLLRTDLLHAQLRAAQQLHVAQRPLLEGLELAQPDQPAHRAHILDIDAPPLGLGRVALGVEVGVRRVDGAGVRVAGGGDAHDAGDAGVGAVGVVEEGEVAGAHGGAHGGGGFGVADAVPGLWGGAGGEVVDGEGHVVAAFEAGERFGFHEEVAGGGGVGGGCAGLLGLLGGGGGGGGCGGLGCFGGGCSGLGLFGGRRRVAGGVAGAAAGGDHGAAGGG